MKRVIIFISTILVLSSCGETSKESDEINLYSQRHYKVDEQQYEAFEKETGIKVNVVKANADELIERLKNEGDNSPADLFITVDAGKLQKAKDLDLLQKISSPIINQNVDIDLKDVNGYWIPITYRARIIVYSKERVNVGELSTYANLTNEKWRNKVLVRSSSNAYNQALLSSIVANRGEEAATNWASELVKNFARDPKGNDRDQVKAITAGQGDLAIVNSYYIGLLLSSENDEEIKAGNSVGVFFPNQGEEESGSHINVSGIGLAKNAPNKENAIKLMEFLTSESAQKTYTNTSYEYPANPNVEPNEIVKKWGSFKKDILDLNQLGVFRNRAIEIFDKSGWK
ncbi:Fe(3+) ABC transporter substrate-binding protein [Flavobacteriaceae bacterium]|jgi:iron(III) transport system substrate-binding protein|nr:Fe(3+) ABC transporter substrate-binding protein [Flavobacteriales bacterium]MBL6878071.1 Fe(3+) ABC transporter substrate-binding protein [Flavobacteriaceae bacterium]MDA8626300.1 Fe(3+) ABC transporter substrate-binding protein [Flavobacteriaceae bacterium]MDA9550711.1 Fe(3+) ABC transporter substrate-binding protein [Flavobacteriaceae bacterium]MDA9849498.1 Fe(3+) ABC transporter substrate-binding protein [Flavobacteriaceae bacterium]